MTYTKAVKCKKCGNTGHNRSSKNCPYYDAEEANRKREEKAQLKEQKKQEEEAKEKQREEMLQNNMRELEAQKGNLLVLNFNEVMSNNLLQRGLEDK